MVQTLDKIALSGSAGNGPVQRRIQHHLGLLERRQLMKVAQELKESHIPRQVRFAEASKHAHVRLEQGEQALCPVLMHVTPRVFLLRMIDVLVYVALQGAVAAGGVRVQPASCLESEVGSLLHRLDSKVPCRLDDDPSWRLIQAMIAGRSLS